MASNKIAYWLSLFIVINRLNQYAIGGPLSRSDLKKSGWVG